MITIDTTSAILEYSPLRPALTAFYTSPKRSALEIVMDNVAAFHDLKTYLSQQKIGFREIYEGERMTIQFTIPQNEVYT